jgi:hypothetical protein
VGEFLPVTIIREGVMPRLDEAYAGEHEDGLRTELARLGRELGDTAARGIARARLHAALFLEGLRGSTEHEAFTRRVDYIEAVRKVLGLTLDPNEAAGRQPRAERAGPQPRRARSRGRTITHCLEGEPLLLSGLGRKLRQYLKALKEASGPWDKYPPKVKDRELWRRAMLALEDHVEGLPCFSYAADRNVDDWRKMFKARECPVCGYLVPLKEGVVWLSRWCLPHRGPCHDLVMVLTRTYRKSSYGRNRQVAKWRRLIDNVAAGLRVTQVKAH